jgi:phosphate transport system protein
MVDHTTHAFDSDLQEIAKKILEMGRSDDKQIADAIEALCKHDAKLARSVIAADDLIDAQQHAIEEKAITTIARRQPMAVDLREIIGALRICNDLERVGDLAENIAKRVLLLTDEFRISEVMLQLQRMALFARDQLQHVLQSYERRNIASALDVWYKDQEIDALDNSLFRELLTYMMENPRNIAFCSHMLFCAKNIERMGDHATNIAETVYYIVEGRSIPEVRPKADLTSKETDLTSKERVAGIAVTSGPGESGGPAGRPF